MSRADERHPALRAENDVEDQHHIAVCHSVLLFQEIARLRTQRARKDISFRSRPAGTRVASPGFQSWAWGLNLRGTRQRTGFMTRGLARPRVSRASSAGSLRSNALSRLTGIRTGWAWRVPHGNPPSGCLASAQLLAQDVEVPADGCDDPFACSSDLGDDRINPRGLWLINWHRHARIPLP